MLICALANPQVTKYGVRHLLPVGRPNACLQLWHPLLKVYKHTPQRVRSVFTAEGKTDSLLDLALEMDVELELDLRLEPDLGLELELDLGLELELELEIDLEP